LSAVDNLLQAQQDMAQEIVIRRASRIVGVRKGLHAEPAACCVVEQGISLLNQRNQGGFHTSHSSMRV
jgi:hypothetical protein